MMLSALLLWLACASPALAIVCYVDIPGNKAPTAATVNSIQAEPAILCLKYQFVCKQGDSACSAEEVGTTKWAYGTTQQDVCNDMKASADMYKSVTCCNTDQCNAPDAMLVAAAKP
jgi:hypothetical protein